MDCAAVVGSGEGFVYFETPPLLPVLLALLLPPLFELFALLPLPVLDVRLFRFFAAGTVSKAGF